MNKVHISTISLASSSMGDLKKQLKEFKEKTFDDGRIYEFGDYYEPIPGYVGIDISVFLPGEVVTAYRALEGFRDDTNKNSTVH